MILTAIRNGLKNKLPIEVKKMSVSKLNKIPNVDIDEGIFKYILLQICQKDGEQLCKNVIRGYTDCKWHNDVFNKVEKAIGDSSLELTCLGGGKIEHVQAQKYLKIYGESQLYGKADHCVTRKIISEERPDYCVEVSD